MVETTKAVEWRKEDGVTVLRLIANEVRESEQAVAISEELKKIAVGIGGRMVFCLDNVRFLSSTGISALVSFNRLLSSLKGELKVCGIQPMILHVMRAAGLDEALEIYKTEGDARAAFKATEA